jgi:hypothetical protein
MKINRKGKYILLIFWSMRNNQINNIIQHIIERYKGGIYALHSIYDQEWCDFFSEQTQLQHKVSMFLWSFLPACCNSRFFSFLSMRSCVSIKQKEKSFSLLVIEGVQTLKLPFCFHSITVMSRVVNLGAMSNNLYRKQPIHCILVISYL